MIVHPDTIAHIVRFFDGDQVLGLQSRKPYCPPAKEVHFDSSTSLKLSCDSKKCLLGAVILVF